MHKTGNGNNGINYLRVEMKLNAYQHILEEMSYNKFVVGDLLFVEYTCPIADEYVTIWTETDYIIHVLRGQKKFYVGSDEWPINEGDSLYVKKGSFRMRQYFDQEFCMMGFFINDHFIRSVLEELRGKVSLNKMRTFEDFQFKRITLNPILQGFFSSMYPFFKKDQIPSNSLLELKLKELIVNIVTSEDNQDLSSYFQSLSSGDKPSLIAIMEKNFCQNLSLEQYAELSHRSLSTFKREFAQRFETTPGKWLHSKRLNYAQMILQNSEATISEIAFQSGFENPAHFSRSFKSKFGISPGKFRDKHASV